MQTASWKVFVYFRADASRTDELLSAIQRHAERLSVQGIQLELSRRPEESRGQITWMETAAVTGGQTAESVRDAIENSALACGVSDLALDGRHVELFVSVNPQTKPCV